MGQNLSFIFPDRSADILSQEDIDNSVRLGIIWALCTYGFIMIFTMLKLIDRWRGPRDDNPTSLGSVLGAFIISIIWPVALAILAVSD